LMQKVVDLLSSCFLSTCCVDSYGKRMGIGHAAFSIGGRPGSGGVGFPRFW